MILFSHLPLVFHWTSSSSCNEISLTMRVIPLPHFVDLICLPCFFFHVSKMFYPSTTYMTVSLFVSGSCMTSSLNIVFLLTDLMLHSVLGPRFLPCLNLLCAAGLYCFCQKWGKMEKCFSNTLVCFSLNRNRCVEKPWSTLAARLQNQSVTWTEGKPLICCLSLLIIAHLKSNLTKWHSFKSLFICSVKYLNHLDFLKPITHIYFSPTGLFHIYRNLMWQIFNRKWPLEVCSTRSFRVP